MLISQSNSQSKSNKQPIINTEIHLLLSGVDKSKRVKNVIDSKHHPLQINFVVKMCEYMYV